MSNVIPSIIKVIDSKVGAVGTKDVTVRVPKGHKLLLISDDEYYELGQPMDDMVLGGHILTSMARVTWDSVEQKWMEV